MSVHHCRQGVGHQAEARVIRLASGRHTLARVQFVRQAEFDGCPGTRTVSVE